jgi:hypothetical protein
MTLEEIEALAQKAKAAQASRLSLEDLADRARMIEIAERRQRLGAGIESATPFDGGVLDPRTGTYKNKQMLAEQAGAPSALSAFASGGFQGASLGWGDELLGGLARVTEGAEYGPMRREEARGVADADRDYAPWTSGLAEVAGGISTALPTAKIATGAHMASTMGRGLGIGATEGTIYGAGSGEGLTDKVNKAVQYGSVGGVLGGALPPLTALGHKAGRGLYDLASARFNVGNTGRAGRAVEEAVERSGKTIPALTREIQKAAADGQGQFRLMDALGMPGMRKASGITRAGGPGADELSEFLMQRQTDAPDRMASFVDDAFGMGGKTRASAEAVVEKNRKTVAKALYKQAAKDADPVDVRDVVSTLDDTIQKMTNSGIEPPAVVSEFMKLKSKLAGMTPDGNPTTLSDYESVVTIWRELRDQIDAAFKSGGPGASVGEALKPIEAQLRSSLEQSSDLFQFANANYREGSRVLDAFQAGADAIRPSTRAPDNIAAFGALTDQQQKAARIGYGDNLIARIEGKLADAPDVSREIASTKRKAETAAMSVDPEKFKARTKREYDMFRTFSRALGGSRTADNLQDIMDVGVLADLSRAAGSMAHGNPGGTASNLWSAAKPYLTGDNEKTRALVAKMLQSDNPARDLAPVMKQKESREAVRRLIENMLRNSGREPANSAVFNP